MEGRYEEVVDLGPGGRWVEILDLDAAMAAQRMSETAVGLYYKARPPGEGAGHRYFGLLSGDGMPVVLRVPPAGKPRSRPDDLLVTGFRNLDPYPAHGPAIAALAERIGTPLPPSSYPYGGRGGGEEPEGEEPEDEAPPPSP